jgi:Transcriptional regulatory protein, C terminal
VLGPDDQRSLRGLAACATFSRSTYSTLAGASCIAGRTLSPSHHRLFDLLDYLIRNRERVVSKDDLIDAIWDGRSVSDAALTTGQMALCVLGYNLTRVLNIVGMKPLLAAVRA